MLKKKRLETLLWKHSFPHFQNTPYTLSSKSLYAHCERMPYLSRAERVNAASVSAKGLGTDWTHCASDTRPLAWLNMCFHMPVVGSKGKISEQEEAWLEISPSLTREKLVTLWNQYIETNATLDANIQHQLNLGRIRRKPGIHERRGTFQFSYHTFFPVHGQE